MHVLAGVDIGGTSVKVGVVTAEGCVLAREQQNLQADKHEPQDVVDLVALALHNVLEKVNLCVDALEAVGVGCPGVLEEGGIVHAASNFPTWKDVPLLDMLAGKLGVKVLMCNDADAAVLAEQWVGSARGGVKDFIMLTLGTGVGFGVVASGKLLRGGSNAIEGGHMIVERNGRPCGCTQRGCLEAYTSAAALVSRAQEHLIAGANSSLSAHNKDEVDARMIFTHAAQGDEMCIHVIEEAADYLGFACVSFCRMLDPEMIVLSGGIAEAGETYIERVRSAYMKYTWTKFPNPVRIEKASVGYDSGIIGAAAVCREVSET